MKNYDLSSKELNDDQREAVDNIIIAISNNDSQTIVVNRIEGDVDDIESICDELDQKIGFHRSIEII